MDKRLEKIKTVPPRSDIKIDELLKALEILGFIWRYGRGSHIIITHNEFPDLYTCIPSPHGGKNCVNKCYIRVVHELIKQLEERKNR